ncbi:UNVERIFIED_CONTAM: hypothetical protein RMT77_017442 [Armadillidium vulgare]
MESSNSSTKNDENIISKTLSDENFREKEESLKRTTTGGVLFKLLLHSVAMFTVPFLVYFCIRNYAEKEYNIHSPRSYIYGCIGAVISVQIIIGSYVYQAFKEESYSWNNKKLKNK